MRTTTRALVLPTALLLAVGIAACGSDGAHESTGTAVPQTTAASDTSSSSADSSASSGSGLGSVSDDASSSSSASTSGSSSAATEADAETKSAQDLEVGDCFTDMGTETADDGATVNTVDVVDCSAPHLYEVYKNADIEADSFPTGDAMDEKTADVCYDAYADYVGKSLDESSLTATALTPTSSSWTLGDRTVSCVITSQDGSDLTSSAKGSHA